jgi:hypothetical protein
MKWMIVLIACVLVANFLFRLLESTLVLFFGVVKSFAKFSASGMSASGLESLAPRIPQY